MTVNKSNSRDEYRKEDVPMFRETIACDHVSLETLTRVSTRGSYFPRFDVPGIQIHINCNSRGPEVKASKKDACPIVERADVYAWQSSSEADILGDRLSYKLREMPRENKERRELKKTCAR